MTQSVPLISTIASGLGLALVLGYVATRAKLPSLVGYLVAGVLIGPFTPGFVADTAIAGELAEIGVMLLMFGVGLHFSLDDLLQVRKIAVPGAILQIVVATAMGAGLAWWWGWGLAGSVVFGLALSVASTVVLLRTLETHGTLDSLNGRIAVGWLIVEDLAMVLVLVLLPALAAVLGGEAGPAGPASMWPTLGWTLVKVSAFIALMMVVGRRVMPKLLWLVARTGSRELFTLSVVAAALSIAYAATTLFGVSFALGAFFAGIAGGLFAHYLRTLNPGTFDFNRSFEIIIMVVLGGMGSISGSVVAAVFLTVLKEILRPLQQLTGMDLRMVIYALVLIIMMLTRPKGIFGTSEIGDLVRGWVRKARKEAT